MNVEQLIEDMQFSKTPIWLLKIKGAKSYSYTFDETDMAESLKYFTKCYDRLPDGDFELILRKNKNQGRGELYRTFTKGTGASNTPSVIGGFNGFNGSNTAIGSTSWGISEVIAGMKDNFRAELAKDRLERENETLRKRIEELEESPAVSGTQEIFQMFDPYLKQILAHHFPVSQGAAVGTLTSKKGEQVPPAEPSDEENDQLSEEQLTRLWAICERFANVFGTSDFDDLLTQFEKLAAKAETMPAVVKGLIS
jgi:hypothetical protein